MRAPPDAALGAVRPPATLDDTPLKPPDAPSAAHCTPPPSAAVASDVADASHADPGMGQNASSQQQLELLQEQLEARFQLAQQPLRSLSPLQTPEVDDQDEALFFAARRRGRSADPAEDSPERSGDGGEARARRQKQRPASSYIPASSWAGQLSQFSFAPRKSIAPAASVSHFATPPRPAAGAVARDPSLSPSASWPTSVAGTLASSPIAEAGLYRTSASAPNLPLVATAPVSEPSSYFSTPAATAASSPTSATIPLPLSGALGLSCPDGPLEFDPELLVADKAAAAAELQDRADAAQLDDRRYHALLELVETERGYLEHLRVLVKVYFQTLPFLTALTVAEVHAVVRNAEQLLALHERIGERIDQVERELHWRKEDAEGEDALNEEDWAFRARRAAGRVARIFSDEMPSFELYNDFCARHAEALDITRSIASRQEWEAFERQCAARVASEAGRGDRTPVASAASYQYFPSISAPPSSNSPLPFSATPLTTPSHSSGTIPTQSSLAASAASSAAASTSRSRLRFADFAIAPVQRITRYPLVFGQLAKYFVDTVEHDALASAWSGFKAVAQGVDAAKRAREGEMRTRVVARRMEFHTPLVGGTFCDILGPTLLVGALHVVHASGGAPAHVPAAVGAGAQGEVLKVKYLGCFLYRSHLVMAKIKKRASYEPREWLPLRLFDIQGVDEGHGLLSHSIRLTFRDHQFELGALCAGERAVWLSHLLEAQSEARRVWDVQDRDEHGQPTLFDDSVVSSVPTGAVPPPRKAHSRSASSISVVSTFGGSSNGHGTISSSSPVLAQEEPMPTIPSEFIDIAKSAAPIAASAILSTSAPLAHVSSPPSSALSIATTPTLASRSRFSSTASSLLLGRTPASQRAAVDLRLADVFSEECLSARAQAAREVELETAASRRFRTMSGPKRSMTALAPGSSIATSPPFGGHKMLHGSSASSSTASTVRERRRMSSVEVGLGLADRAEFRGAIGFDVTQAALYHAANAKMPALGLVSVTTTPEKERGRGWASAIRHKAGNKTGGGSGSTSVPRVRPALPEIDTALAEHIARAGAAAKRGSVPPLSAGGSWSRRGRAERDRDRDGGLGGQLRRVASHGSVDATPSVPQTPLPTMLVLPNTPTAPQDPRAVTGAITSGAADVERNNSVSSTASSSGTGTHSSSSHAHSLQVLDTPPSSIPPSPDFCTVELAEALFPPPQKTSLAISGPPHMLPHGAPPSPRWSTVSDGVSSVFRLRRRKSTLGLVPPAFPARSSPSTSDENLTSRSPTLHPTEAGATTTQQQHLVPARAAVKLQRRASTTISGLFSGKKRAQSSPSLAGPGGYFAGPSTSSPHLPLSRTPSHSPESSAVSSPSQTPEAGAALQLAPAPSAPAASSSSSLTSSAETSTKKRVAKDKAGAGGNKGPLLLRTRTRFLFASHHGMTPMS
ncbi:hypothetical protein JCM10450v2_001418 [Rhodotorula kratochvilovae]